MRKKTNPYNTPYFSFRFKFLIIIFQFVLLVLSAKIFFITVIKGNQYYESSENNFLRYQNIEPPRGNIFDRNRIPIAINSQTYSIYITKYKIPLNNILKTIKEVSSVLKKEIPVNLQALKKKKRWEPVLLLKGLSFEEVLPIYERMYKLDGISIENNYDRYYPYGQICSNLTGFVSLISSKELETLKDEGYTNKSYIGRSGIEKQYEKFLHGIKGEDVIILDAKGRIIDSYENIQPGPGIDIETTIDIDIQKIAYEALKPFKGAAVAADPQNGEILAFVSFPSFDPNNLGAPDNYFINKNIREYYAPGSTFKPVTALAGLREGFKDKMIFCDSYFYLKGRENPFRCDFKPGHGTLNLKDAIKYSCNIYFYTIANSIGGEKLLGEARRFGFGEKTGIDVPGERSGFLPSSNPQSLFRGDVVILGIGQGKLNVTPIQVLRHYCALGNGGKLIIPHFLRISKETQFNDDLSRSLDEIKSTFISKDIPIIKENFQEVREGLYKVINEEGGTGFRVGFKKEWNAAGKTGTAQNWRSKEPDAWFACWAPFDNPKIAVTVIIENAGHGSEFAAPVARDIMAEFFKKNKL